MWTIARLTVLETRRRRLLLLTMVMTAAFFVLFWFLAHSFANGANSGAATLSEGQLLLQNYQSGMTTLFLGLFFVYFMIAFFSIFSLAGAVAGDAESGLLAAILPRPLHRASFLIGKWTGFAAVQAVYVAVMVTGVALIVHLVFPTAPVWTPRLFSAGAVFILEAWTVAAVTLLGSVLFSALANGIGVSILFGIAFLVGAADQISSGAMRYAGSKSVTGIAHTLDHINTLLSLVFPSDGLYRRALYEVAGPGAPMLQLLSRLLGPFGVSTPPSVAFIVYSVLYLVAVLSISCWAFSRRDL